MDAEKYISVAVEDSIFLIIEKKRDRKVNGFGQGDSPLSLT